MKQKLAVIAVAGAFAAPGLALAQTSVTISGYVKVAVGQISNSSATPTAAGVLPRAGLNSSESRLNDDGSRIAFTIRDQIDSNLAGIAQIELRPTIDGNSGVNGGGSGAGFGSSTGNNYIGLESKDFGTLKLGALEQHYNQNTETSSTYAPSQVATGLLNWVYIAQPASGVSNAVAQNGINGASRTPNIVRWDSPNWSGFRLGVGYSFNQGSGQEADLTTGGRKGNSLVLNPTYTAQTWRVGYSYLDDKRDGPAGTASTGNWKGNRLFGEVQFSDFTVGFNWDKTAIDTVTAAGVVTKLSNRTAWSLPVKYQTGKHVITGMYSKAQADKVLLGDTSAKNWSVSYAYLFSARTSIGVGYSVLTNGALGAYTLQGEQPKGGASGANFQTGYNSANSAAFTGEKQTYLGVVLRQAF
jgi:predicted porin